MVMNLVARLGRGFLHANAQALESTVRCVPHLATLLPGPPLIIEVQRHTPQPCDNTEASCSNRGADPSATTPSISAHSRYEDTTWGLRQDRYSVSQTADYGSRWMSSVPIPVDDAEEGPGSSALKHQPVRYETEALDPFSLVADELSQLGAKMRDMVATEVPKLAQAAEYFFRMGAEGKRFRPTVLLLMATALSTSIPGGVVTAEVQGVRDRQWRIAEITEMIHVASLLHDDVLDSSDTRRGISSLNFLMGNKLAVLAGDFLLARASVALASLRNVEVIELLSRVLEHLVSGEIMQMTGEPEARCSFDYYVKKTYNKTASLIANSCKSIAILGGQPPEVAVLAYDYGRHLGLSFQMVDDLLDFVGTSLVLGKPALADLKEGIATAPVLFAAEEFPMMTDLIKRKFSRSGDVEQAVHWQDVGQVLFSLSRRGLIPRRH